MDHLIIHDDNFGPYMSLSSRSLEIDQKVQARYLIALKPWGIKLSATRAEAIAAGVLKRALPMVKSKAQQSWLKYLVDNQWRYVLRTVLVDRATYEAHLRDSRGHNGSQILAAELGKLSNLPDRFWMVEFSLPNLFTGNRSKLGEVLVDAETTNHASATLAVRVPEFMIMLDAQGKGLFDQCSLSAHSPIFRFMSHDNEW